MSNISKRRDSKNRVLKEGESQRKDGRYAFKFLDNDGKYKTVYSWKLTKTDITPAGKRDGPSLREKEEGIIKQLYSRDTAVFSQYSIRNLLDDYYGNKVFHTVKYYNTTLVLLKAVCKSPYINKKINEVNFKVARDLLIDIQRTNNYKFGTMRLIKSLFHQAFSYALKNESITKNPFDFSIGEIFSNDNKKVIALLPEEKNSLLDFLKDEKKSKSFSFFYDYLQVLFDTGLRISEFCALTKDDIDFNNRMITVNKQLIKVSRKNKILSKGYHITNLKTKRSMRRIPMTDNAKICLENIILKSKKYKNFVVDGYTDFIVLSEKGCLCDSGYWSSKFYRISELYADYSGEFIKVSPHICRHTFCSDMVRNGLNPKVIQTIMGHSTVAISYDVYTDISIEKITEEFIEAFNE